MKSQEAPLAVNIRPEVTILSVLQHLNYKPWFALAEFVDNSLASFLRNRDGLKALHGKDFKLRVEIEMSPDAGAIVVRDNAAGISRMDFPRAFRPAELPPDRTGLCEFGMGMKSAACWFASQWRVRTKALGEPEERVVYFDIGDIVKKKREHLEVVETPANPNWHYTEITLLELGKRFPQTKTLKKIKDHLASIYRVFIRRRELELVVDGEPLTYHEPAVLSASYYKDPEGSSQVWRKTIEFDFGMGQKVTGFAALRKEGSTTHAGFALFRRDRLIEGSGDETYRPIEIFGNSNSYRYQRLFGELHIEGFQVSHTKDGFRWEDEEEAFLEILRDELEKAPLNLLSQAEGYRARPPRATTERKAEAATKHVTEVIERDVPPVLGRDLAKGPDTTPPPAEIPKSSLQASEQTVQLKLLSQQWEVTVRTVVDPAVGDWLRIADSEDDDRCRGTSDARHLTIVVSLEHPFVSRFIGAHQENMELFIRFAVAVALAQIAAADVGASGPQTPLLYLNNLLREALANP
ncbi:MAG: ATP-binding protein [Rhodocyclales bacterium]|nr:MAG: ATP-binding protein [Rhodocyclales bacterium]